MSGELGVLIINIDQVVYRKLELMESNRKRT